MQLGPNLMGLQRQKSALLPPYGLKGFQTPGGLFQFFFQSRQTFPIIPIPIGVWAAAILIRWLLIRTARFARGSRPSGHPAPLRLFFGSWFFLDAH